MSQKSALTTHVLDTSTGRPAAGLRLVLERRRGGRWAAAGRGVTDADGRCGSLLPPGPLPRGQWRLTFRVGDYFRRARRSGFYPEVSVVFAVRDARHHHVPLLLSPWGYSTYRGS